MLVARHQTELELDAQNIGNLLQQVHGIAHVAIVTLRILFGLIEHQEGFALQEMSRYFRVLRTDWRGSEPRYLANI